MLWNFLLHIRKCGAHGVDTQTDFVHLNVLGHEFWEQIPFFKQMIFLRLDVFFFFLNAAFKLYSYFHSKTHFLHFNYNVSFHFSTILDSVACFIRVDLINICALKNNPYSIWKLWHNSWTNVSLNLYPTDFNGFRYDQTEFAMMKLIFNCIISIWIYSTKNYRPFMN